MGQQGPRVPTRESAFIAQVLSYDADRPKFQGTPGLTTQAIKNKLSLRASLTGSIFLDNVVVRSEDALLPKAIGLGAAFGCLNSAR
jgi:alkylation response protein AidB-like acyl-CoA dehydrogenase